jgi:hypothetical protein
MLDNNAQDSKGGLIRVMGLWENTDKRGNKYLSGSIGGVRVMIFANTFKQGEREPDYRLFISQRSQEERGGAAAGPMNTDLPPQTGPEDDIPF